MSNNQYWVECRFESNVTNFIVNAPDRFAARRAAKRRYLEAVEVVCGPMITMITNKSDVPESVYTSQARKVPSDIADKNPITIGCIEADHHQFNFSWRED